MERNVDALGPKPSSSTQSLIQLWENCFTFWSLSFLPGTMGSIISTWQVRSKN